MTKELDSLLEKVNELFIKLEDRNIAKKAGSEYMVVFLGVLVELISSKKLFKRNIEVVEFLDKKFGITFADYVKKSRPLMIGKTVTYFLQNDEYVDVKDSLNRLYGFIVAVINGKQNDLTWSDVIKSIKL